LRTDWQQVPLGAYRAGSFWLVALIFASEHGPYWEVGLAAGAILWRLAGPHQVLGRLRVGPFRDQPGAGYLRGCRRPNGNIGYNRIPSACV